MAFDGRGTNQSALQPSQRARVKAAASCGQFTSLTTRISSASRSAISLDSLFLQRYSESVFFQFKSAIYRSSHDVVRPTHHPASGEQHSTHASGESRPRTATTPAPLEASAAARCLVRSSARRRRPRPGRRLGPCPPKTEGAPRSTRRAATTGHPHLDGQQLRGVSQVQCGDVPRLVPPCARMPPVPGQAPRTALPRHPDPGTMTATEAAHPIYADVWTPCIRTHMHAC